MHARFLTTISLVVGTGITVCIFLTIARYLRLQEQAPASPVLSEELEKVAIALPPPPPPPKKLESTPVDEALSEAVPLGFVEEPSASPVKIPPSPPDFEKLLPMTQTPVHVIAGTVGIGSSLKPAMNVSFDVDHVFQRSEVDKPPFVVSRSDPDVGVSVLGETGRRSVVLLFVVSTRGEVGKVRILQSSDSSEFDELMAEYIGQWLFSPAIRKGKPVRCMIQQRITVQQPQRDKFSL